MKTRLFLSLLAAAAFETAGANASSSSFSGRGRALLQAEGPVRSVPDGDMEGDSLKLLVHRFQACSQKASTVWRCHVAGLFLALHSFSFLA